VGPLRFITRRAARAADTCRPLVTVLLLGQHEHQDHAYEGRDLEPEQDAVVHGCESRAARGGCRYGKSSVRAGATYGPVCWRLDYVMCSDGERRAGFSVGVDSRTPPIVSGHHASRTSASWTKGQKRR
jgi:hypothetical protein